MEYLFLRRKKTTATSERQKSLLYRAAEKQWMEKFADREDVESRKVDCSIYKGILYQLEIRQAFLDASLSLKKLSEILETNQTYVSNVVNKYFDCNLKELLNRYRVEYAKELLRADRCAIDEVPARSGFKSKSTFYAAFAKEVGLSPLSFQNRERRERNRNVNIMN